MSLMFLLLGVIIGLMIGWYARNINELLRAAVGKVDARRKAKVESKQDTSGVVIGNEVYERGKVIKLPEYKAPDAPTGIIRARSPQQVKQDSDRQWQQTLEEYKG